MSNSRGRAYSLALLLDRQLTRARRENRLLRRVVLLSLLGNVVAWATFILVETSR
jgi:hypothetical protein